MSQRPRKHLGQHFLHDRALIGQAIAAIAPRPGDHMIEIGPGRGAITLPLLERLGTLEVVELDRSLIPELQKICAPLGQLIVHQGDVLAFDFNSVAPQLHTLRVVGNLPYNISTPILFHLIAAADKIRDMHFLLQKEVVQRMAAPPGNKAYGRLSVMIQYHCRTEVLFAVPPGAFTPPPKVDSAFIRLVPYTRLPYCAKDERWFALMVRLAFSKRRKTLRNALRNHVADEHFLQAEIDPTRRAETLSVDEFVRLADASATGP